jgi:ribosomal protein L11 methyltransferase
MTQAIHVRPRWRIVPPGEPPDDARIPIIVSPGAGWGTGAHETTQLCLQAIALMAPTDRPWRMLDFGAGSGILAVGAARLGAAVDAVEIDEAAIANAQENMRLNDVADRVRVSRSLDAAPGPHDMVVANILRPVLLAFAEALTARLAPGGTLLLSGLVSTDLPELSVRYTALLGGRRPQQYQLGEWRALAWSLRR